MMELSFPSELGYEVVARDAVATFARCTGIDKERIEDIKTALSEACINAIEHGNSLKAGLRVTIKCVYDSGYLRIDIFDEGVQVYEPGKAPLSIAEKLAGLGPLRGMGLMLIEELSDEAGFEPVAKGNCYRLKFYNQAERVGHEASLVDSSD